MKRVRRDARFTAIAASLGVLLPAGAACSTQVETVNATAVEHGKQLLFSRETSPSRVNEFSCASCHSAEQATANSRIYTGASLAGSLRRPHYWGGQVVEILDAINACRASFMSASDPWAPSDTNARALYAFLEALPGGTTGAIPFTVVEKIALPAAGDPARGKELYDRSCGDCHGIKSTGAGKTASRAPALPEQTLNEHTYLSPDDRRLIFVEKVRHGVFLGYSGTMPPYSAEVLSDADLGAILQYLDIYK